MNTILILVLILVILLIFFENKLYNTYFGGIRVKKSPIGGNGVFAKKNFIVGETIEIAPLLKEHEDNMKGLLNDYLFTISEQETEKGNYAFALGYGGLYNHSDDNNARWKVDGDNLIVKAIKPIEKGDEIFVSYGDDYWTSREYRLEKN